MKPPEKTKESPPPPAKSRLRHAIPVLLIIAVGTIAYASSVTNQFVWDDKFLIEKNNRIESFSNIPQVLKEDLCHMLEEPTGYYRPMQTISYMADHFLWGRFAPGYHITNILLQIITSIAVYFLCVLLMGERWKSLFVAAAFCTNPSFVPIAGYIAGRADILGLLFALCAIYAAIKSSNTHRKHLAWLSILFYAFSATSKEYYLVTPLFIALYLYVWPNISADQKKPLKNILFGMVTVALVYVFLRLTVLNFHQRPGAIAGQALLTRFALSGYILTNYILTLIAPFNIGMEKTIIFSSIFEPKFLISFITPAALFLILYYFGKRRAQKEIFFIAWFILGIVPVLNLLVPLKVYWANHWVYMASIGFYGFLAIATYIKKYSALTRVRQVIAVIMVASFVVLSFQENKNWKDEATFFAKTMAISPDSSRATFNMAEVYREKCDYKNALELYNKALAMNQSGYIFNGRGLLYMNMGDTQKARVDFEKAVQLVPSVAYYRNNLGGLYIELGMINEARRELKEALRLDPDNEMAKHNLELIGSE